MQVTYRAIFVVLVLLAGLGGDAVARDPFQRDIGDAQAAQLDEAAQLRSAGKTDEAIGVLSALTKSNPNYYSAQYNLGLAYADKKQYAQAKQHLQAAADLQQKYRIVDPTLYNSLGWTYLIQNDYAHAEQYLGSAYKQFDKLPTPDAKRKLLNNYGLLYLSKGDHAKAEPLLTRAANEYNSELAKENLTTLQEVRKTQIQRAAR